MLKKKCPNCHNSEYVYKIKYGFIPDLTADQLKELEEQRIVWRTDTLQKSKLFVPKYTCAKCACDFR